MSAAFPISFHPTSAHGDDLAAVVVRRLERRPPCPSWGLFKTIVLGVPSFGLLPLLVWPARFREHLAEESLALKDLGQWARLRGRQPAAVGPLLATAEETSPSPLPLVMALVLSALVVGVFAIQFTHVSFSIDALLELTYLRDPEAGAYSPLSHPEFIYRVWVIALSIGFALQWIQVRTHIGHIERFLERFSPVAAAEGLPGIRLPRRSWTYVRPLWILTAVLLAVYHAWWGIPMVLAGLAQKQYTGYTGRLVRRELARRIKDIMTLRHPPGPELIVLQAEPRCDNPRCLAALRPHARFCPRCGLRANEGRA